jgi:hypothetical protein
MNRRGRIAVNKYETGDIVFMEKGGKKLETEITGVHFKGGKYLYDLDKAKEPVPEIELKRAASTRIASCIVASEVQTIMIQQVRAFTHKQRQALLKIFGKPFSFYGVVKMGSDTIAVRYKSSGTDDEMMAGFKLKYDYGSDTYVFTPFVTDLNGGTIWGRDSSDFYVEDLGDVTKLEFIFESVKR